MVPHDFMTLHAAKTIEYLIAVAYLLLFIPFWRYVNAGPAALPVRERVRARTSSLKDLFAVPAGLFYHPGHAWARIDGADTVTVGFDDFAAKLVGPPSAITLPNVGATLAQGEPAWTLVADGKAIEMLSPVDGTVVAVNHQAAGMPDAAHARPYDTGWLLKVRSPRLAANVKQLLSGALARQWMDNLADGLRGELAPALGAVYEDGGGVVDGLARSLEPDGWEQLARRYFLTEPVTSEDPTDALGTGRQARAESPAIQGGDHA